MIEEVLKEITEAEEQAETKRREAFSAEKKLFCRRKRKPKSRRK